MGVNLGIRIMVERNGKYMPMFLGTTFTPSRSRMLNRKFIEESEVAEAAKGTFDLEKKSLAAEGFPKHLKAVATDFVVYNVFLDNEDLGALRAMLKHLLTFEPGNIVLVIGADGTLTKKSGEFDDD